MPKKSKKSKSKRTTLKQKYKVIRKVKEHHRKKAKELRKSGRKAKPPKDPGIPSQWPFKEQLLKELEWQKQNILEKEKKRKEERRLAREQQQALEADVDMAERPTLQDVQAAADTKLQAFDAANAAHDAPAAAADSGGQRRAFQRELARVVEAADVVVEVLDARDPLACRCAALERAVRRAGVDKRLVLLLNKIDLVPREVAEAWLTYLREELPTVAFKCSTQKQAAHLGQRHGLGVRGRGKGRTPAAPQPPGIDSAVGADRQLEGSECLGAETLLQLLKNYARTAGSKAAITVGVVGLPNVGKSSLINSLKRARVAATGNTPGVTRSVQHVHLDRTLTLLDSPGVVLASAVARGDGDAALHNCIKVEQVEDPTVPVAAIVARCPAAQLSAQYRVAAFQGADEFLRLIAHARGKLRPGGLPDTQAAARIVLMDWNSGRIPYFTWPPKRPDHGHATAAVVPAWGADFDIDKVFAAERSAVLAGLAPLDDVDRNFMEAHVAGPGPALLQDMDASSPEPALEAGTASREALEAMDEEDKAALLGTRAQPSAPTQTEALYAEEGQFNPHLARAVKKRQKKEARQKGTLPPSAAAPVQPAAASHGKDEDYDFTEAWGQAGEVDDMDEADGLAEAQGAELVDAGKACPVADELEELSDEGLGSPEELEDLCELEEAGA